MNLELRALKENETWESHYSSLGKRAIGYKRSYKTKFYSDETIKKAQSQISDFRLQTKVCNGYKENFTLVAKTTLSELL